MTSRIRIGNPRGRGKTSASASPAGECEGGSGSGLREGGGGEGQGRHMGVLGDGLSSLFCRILVSKIQAFIVCSVPTDAEEI